MASSEKAGALKDAFVNAIADELGGEAMAQAGAMENAKLAGKLGLDVGDQATVYADLDRGTLTGRNDGLPDVYITKGGRTNHSTANHSWATNPSFVGSAPAHQKKSVPLSGSNFKYFNDLNNINMQVNEAEQDLQNFGDMRLREAQRQNSEIRRNGQEQQRWRQEQNQRERNQNRTRQILPNTYGGYTMY